MVELLRLVVQQRGHIVDFDLVGCNLCKEVRVSAICGWGGRTRAGASRQNDNKKIN